MLGGKALDKKVSLAPSYLCNLSWFPGWQWRKKAQLTATSCAIVDCVIRVMRAWIVEPHSRAPETAWPCRHSVLQWALHRHLNVRVRDRTVDGYTQTCACDTRWHRNKMIAWNITGYSIIVARILKRSNWKRRICSPVSWWMCYGRASILAWEKNVKELVWKYEVQVMKHCECLVTVSTSVECRISGRSVSLSNRKIMESVVLAQGDSWTALTEWSGLSNLILGSFTALPDKDILLFCCALV